MFHAIKMTSIGIATFFGLATTASIEDRDLRLNTLLSPSAFSAGIETIWDGYGDGRDYSGLYVGAHLNWIKNDKFLLSLSPTIGYQFKNPFIEGTYLNLRCFARENPVFSFEIKFPKIDVGLI